MHGHDIAVEVVAEFARARSLFPSFHSPHEGYAALLEEVDELWDEVKASKPGSGRAAMRAEAIQVAAMALRFVHDLCSTQTESPLRVAQGRGA